MAIQSFYISIEITENEKRAVIKLLNLQRIKNDNDLTYNDVIYIENVCNEEGNWWHINACYTNFFYNCEMLYKLCQVINETKPRFQFILLGNTKTFEFKSLLEFIGYIYANVKPYKDRFEEMYGNFSVMPPLFFEFRRKNKKYFKFLTPQHETNGTEKNSIC